jgi:hypothetical protein
VPVTSPPPLRSVGNCLLVRGFVSAYYVPGAQTELEPGQRSA